MSDSILLFLASYLAIGAVFVRRCAFETRLAGWRGQAAVLLAFCAMSAVWPMLAYYTARARLRRLVG
ncbi:hypothetical protein [Arenibaculum pallidiluteum]|uniref:hypothetical protein n=1 Tax=Arenibaculum pallidiluteum TaxID=2812559 RepID=UPI001A9761E5|nr:hypothetical protein [Arenibaculum pallidiluteum]